MSKAMELSKMLEQLDIAEGMQAIEEANNAALYFDVIDDAMCIMHDDGSVNIIENIGNGVITSEVVTSANILKILLQYRPFKEVFKSNLQ